MVNQKVASLILERAGYQVDIVSNGREAIETLDDSSYDLVFMDVQMPEMGGFEATNSIRKKEQGSARHIPIIAMTAHAMKGDRERCLEAGMDDYVPKPIQVQDVLDAIARWTNLDAGGLKAAWLRQNNPRASSNKGPCHPHSRDFSPTSAAAAYLLGLTSTTLGRPAKSEKMVAESSRSSRANSPRTA